MLENDVCVENDKRLLWVPKMTQKVGKETAVIWEKHVSAYGQNIACIVKILDKTYFVRNFWYRIYLVFGPADLGGWSHRYTHVCLSVPPSICLSV